MWEARAGHRLEDDVCDAGRSLRCLQDREFVEVWNEMGRVVGAGSLFPCQDCAAFVVTSDNDACSAAGYAVEIVFDVELAAEGILNEGN